MIQEDQEILLIDLCARLSYGVKIHIDCIDGCKHIVGDAILNKINTITNLYFDFCDFEQDFTNGDCCPPNGFGGNFLLKIENFKPYLRPMLSMTEEEWDEISKIDWKRGIMFSRHLTLCIDGDVIDLLNKKMLDWRGLIEKGLALEAPEGMYNV